MSPRPSEKKTVKVAPKPDIYLGLLFVALAALVGGAILLSAELTSYGWELAK